MMNMKKVRFLATGTHFSILHMKLENHSGKMQNCKWRMIY